ncbi:PPE family protein PPE39, partial [Mycobacterium tuberculosis TKK-01-0037]
TPETSRRLRSQIRESPDSPGRFTGVLNTGYGNSGFYNAAVNNTGIFVTGVMSSGFFNFGTGNSGLLVSGNGLSGFFKNLFG